MRIRPFLRSIRLEREEVPDFSRYPFSIPALGSLDTLEFHEKVTFLVGENGSGKSTLVSAGRKRPSFPAGRVFSPGGELL